MGNGKTPAQRHDGTKSLLRAGRHRQNRAGAETSELRRQLVAVQQDRVSLATELATAQRALQLLEAERQKWAKTVKLLEGHEKFREEAVKYKAAVRLLAAEAHQLREVAAKLREPERARQLITAELLEARAEAQASAQLLQKAAELEAGLEGARDLHAELKMGLPDWRRP